MKSGLNIGIDLRDIFSEVLPTKQQAKEMTKKVLQDVTVSVLEAWKSAARRELKSTRENYIKSLYIVESGRLENSIILGGNFNNMIEAGISAFDMKEGFSKSSKRKFSKDGSWYLRIPFRFATPGALGESSAFSGILPKAVHSAAQNAGKTSSGKPKGIKPIALPDDLKAPKSRAAFSDSSSKKQYDEYKHKASIYEGITKSSKFYEETSQGQYNSFRTVGEKSDQNVFIHPGLKVGNFAEKGIKAIDVGMIVENSVDAYLG